jgi:serine/threonine protein kinase
MPGGSLKSVLQEFGPLKDNVRLIVVRGILNALDYLQKCRPSIRHNDVKSANVLVGASNCIVKLADFGLSEPVRHPAAPLKLVGTPGWMAPEVVRQDISIGSKSDMWSFGCTVLETFTCCSPWPREAFATVATMLFHVGYVEGSVPPLPTGLSALWIIFLRGLLRRKAKRRLSAASAVDWLGNVH